MTHKEHLEYDELTLDEKEIYNKVSKEHPNWSHEQRMFYSVINSSTTSGYIDEEEKEESIWKSIKRFFS